jgi:hypothetical protein
VEKILKEAGEKGTLSAAEEACEALKEIMEEGLAHCHRLQTQYFITSLMLSGGGGCTRRTQLQLTHSSA